jgi:hypothetical protein
VRNILIGALITSLLTCGIAQAQDAATAKPDSVAPAKSAPTAEEIAKKLANPIASMISVPMQSNTDVGIGADNGSKLVFNVQPVIPFALGPKLNLITRWIVPFVSQFDVKGSNTSQAGFGDATISAFLGPSQSKVVWGVGSAFIVPIASDDALAGKKWGVGPSFIVLKQSNGWTVGALANYIASVAGDADRPDLSSTFINPFLAYNWKSGAGLTMLGEYTHDFTNDIDVIVLMPQLSAVSKFGDQLAQFAIAPRLHVAPDGHAQYGLRASFTLVFPKK